MGTAPWVESLEMACHRFGPGRLPRAEDPAIGAGYAGATAALVVAVTFAAGMIALDGWPAGSGGGVVFAAVAIVAVPVVVPAAFASAAAVWRYLPDSVPHYGAVAGVLATVVTYLTVLVALFGIGLVNAILGSPHYGPFVEATRFAGTFGFVGFVFTVWLAAPVGCASGYVYERVTASP